MSLPSPPDSSSPDSEEYEFARASARSVRFSAFRAALQNARLLGVLLIVALGLIIARTLIIERETPDERLLSDMYDKSFEALSATKSAYRPVLVAMLPAPDPKPSFPADSRNRTSSSPASKIIKRPSPGLRFHPHEQVATPVAKDDKAEAVAKWRVLANSRYARAAEWRRLGIASFLFHQPDGLKAFAHVGDTFRVLPGQVASRHPKHSLRASASVDSTAADPFGHGKVAISSKDEIAAWQAIYGPAPLSAAQVPALRQTLSGLHLGWFENVAAAHLYAKAGMPAQATEAASAANESSVRARSLEGIQINLILYGFLALLGWGIASFVRWIQQPSTANVPAHPLVYTPVSPKAGPFETLPAPQMDMSGMTAYAPPLSGYAIPSRSLPTRGKEDGKGAGLFPYPVLMLAFLAYLATHEGIGLLLRLVLRPFTGALEDWSSLALLRLETGLQFGLYVPVVLLPLLVLRARVKFDPVSGQRLRFRDLLARIGYRGRNIPLEMASGAWAYVLAMPLIAIIGVISHYMFRHFHTPVNPAEFETLAARFPLDKVMVFLLAAVAAPVVEETMFRGLLYPALRSRFGIAWAAILSAAVFAGVHPTLPGGFLPIWAIGVALALVYEKRGSLLPGIMLHGIHNGLITLLGFAIFSR